MLFCCCAVLQISLMTITLLVAEPGTDQQSLSQGVSIPAQDVLYKAAETISSNCGQGQVQLQSDCAQTLSDDAEGRGEEEAQGSDALGDRAGELVAKTGA